MSVRLAALAAVAAAAALVVAGGSSAEPITNITQHRVVFTQPVSPDICGFPPEGGLQTFIETLNIKQIATGPADAGTVFHATFTSQYEYRSFSGDLLYTGQVTEVVTFVATPGDNVIVFTAVFHDIAQGGPTVRGVVHMTTVDGEVKVTFDRPTVTGC
jgi:hypothetical protein